MTRHYDLIVIGASYGGIEALITLLPELSKKVSIPIVVVIHTCEQEDNLLAEIFSKKCNARVVVAEERITMDEKTIYFSPSGYHLLVDETGMFSYSSEQRVSYSKPSIDVLFESAAIAFDEKVIAIILTGANEDGAYGIKKIHEAGGVAIAQNPKTAQVATMPQAAIDTGCVDYIVDLEAIANQVLITIDGDT